MPNIEKKQQAEVKKTLRRRKTGLGVARKKYMEARRLATAALRKEKKTIEAGIKATISKLKRGQKTKRKAVLVADLKKRWRHFLEKYPHWKKVKTAASLRRLTLAVAVHRLKA